MTGSMSAFQHSRKIREWENKGIDWSSDGCSWAPDKPSGFNFLPACQRHDFGYRNFKKQHIFNQKYKKRIDLRFAQDMFDVCNKYSGARKTLCESFAVTYYKAVSKAGS
ncbi:phospholipase [Streptomyces sp. NPDC001339]|uniref:phospholipase n=1 Tax=Streptomyces sp. NPDC001339 TaxID=3364563 RepID=UPI00368E6F0D